MLFDGLRVLEFGQDVAAPLASMLLAARSSNTERVCVGVLTDRAKGPVGPQPEQ